MKIVFKNKLQTFFFQEDDHIACKTRLFVSFTSLIQMERIIDFRVDTNLFYRKKNENLFKIFKKVFSCMKSAIFLLRAP